MGWLSEHLSVATVSGHRRRKSWAGPGKKICFSGVRRGDEVGKRRVLKLSVSLRSEVSSQALQMTVFPKQMGSPSKMSFCFHFSHKISERETQGREAWWGWGLVCSRPVTSDSWPCQGLQLARPPSPSPSPSLLKLMSIKSMMLSSHLILWHLLPLCPQSFPASGTFPVSQLFASDGPSTGTHS